MRRRYITIIVLTVLFFHAGGVSAFDMFGVDAPAIGENLAGGNPQNTQNWPPEIVRAIKADQAEAIEKMEESGYQNWDVVRSVQGKVLSVEVEKSFWKRLWDALTSFIKRIFGIASDRFNFEGTDVILGPRHCPPPKFERDPITGKSSEVKIFGILVDIEKEQKAKAEVTMSFKWDFLGEGWNCTPGNPEGTVGPELASVPQTVIPDTARNITYPSEFDSVKKIQIDVTGSSAEVEKKAESQLDAKGADQELIGRFSSVWEWLGDFVQDIFGDTGPSSYPSLELGDMAQAMHKSLKGNKTQGVCEVGGADARGVQALGDMFNSRLSGAFFDTMGRIGGYLIGVLDSPNAGKEILKKLGEDFLKEKIKEAVGATERDETVVQTRSTPCEQTATLHWDKKDSKLSFTLSGNCSCQEVPIKWEYDYPRSSAKIAGYSLLMTADVDVILQKGGEEFKFYAVNIKRESKADCESCRTAEQLKIAPSPKPPLRDEEQKASCDIGVYETCINNCKSLNECLAACPGIPCFEGLPGECWETEPACLNECVQTSGDNCPSSCLQKSGCGINEVPPKKN